MHLVKAAKASPHAKFHSLRAAYTDSSIKLSRSNLFGLYFIEKEVIRGANGKKF